VSEYDYARAGNWPKEAGVCLGLGYFGSFCSTREVEREPSLV